MSDDDNEDLTNIQRARIALLTAERWVTDGKTDLALEYISEVFSALDRIEKQYHHQ